MTQLLGTPRADRRAHLHAGLGLLIATTVGGLVVAFGPQVTERANSVFPFLCLLLAAAPATILLRSRPIVALTVWAVLGAVGVILVVRTTPSVIADGIASVAGLGGGELESSVARGNLLISLWFLCVGVGLLFGLRHRSARPDVEVVEPLRGESEHALSLARVLFLAVLAFGLGLALRSVSDPLSRVDATASTGLVQAAVAAGWVTPAAICLYTRRASLALLMAGLLIAPMWGLGGRQGAITPILLALLAMIAVHFRARALTFKRAASISIAVLVFSGAIYAMTAVLTAERAAPGAGLESAGSVQQVLAGGTINDFYFVAVAFEPRPQFLDIYGSSLFAVVPRVLWPDKPVPYDFALLEKYAPEYEGGTPIGIVGTSYLSFLEPGVVLIGMAFGYLLARAAALLESSDTRRILMGAVLVVAFVDVARIGGGLRELSLLIPQVVAVVFVFRRSRTVAYGPV